MSVIPNTEVRFLSNVPLNKNLEHTMDFTDKTAQSTYFSSKASQTFTGLTYQRDNGAIRVPKGYAGLYNCNYIMFRNNDFDTKWFYAFITKKEYVNPEMTLVWFEIDPYQTWQFDLDFKPSFIVREHTKRWNTDGTPVVNTVPEDLDYGSEYNTVQVTQYVPFTDVFFLVIVCKQRMDVNAVAGKEIQPVVNGAIQPLTYYVHPFKMDGSIPSITVDGMGQTLSPVADVLRAIYTNTKAVNNISALYITESIGQDSLAFSMTQFEPVNIQEVGGSNFVTLYVKDVKAYEDLNKTFGDKYAGFTTVTESKLLMYPYTVTILTDMKGNHKEIKPEYIQGTTLDLVVKGSIGVSNKVSYNVKNYLMGAIANGGEVAIADGIVNNSPNDVPIITDLLSAYLQGNRNTLENQKSQILTGQIFGAVGSAISKNPLGVIESASSGYLQMQGVVAKQKDIDNVPPMLSRLGGNTAFDYGNDLKGVYIVKKEITPEYRKKLTDYFKMYGYKLNEVKAPNLKTRAHYNFVHTIGANITGNVPQEDLERIQQMFNNGVTIWHGDWVGDYTKTNGEI